MDSIIQEDFFYSLVNMHSTKDIPYTLIVVGTVPYTFVSRTYYRKSIIQRFRSANRRIPAGRGDLFVHADEPMCVW